MSSAPQIADFWDRARKYAWKNHARLTHATPPETWSFGATPEHADNLLELVLAGIKTGTASSLWDYEYTGEPIPQEGELSIILDGADHPRALIETTSITIVPFNDVTPEHAHSEGEGDLTLEYWRAAHERFWTSYSEDPRGFDPNMPVICERFRLLYSE